MHNVAAVVLRQFLHAQGEYIERKREAVQAVYEVRPVPGPSNKVCSYGTCYMHHVKFRQLSVQHQHDLYGLAKANFCTQVIGDQGQQFGAAT